MDQIVQSYVTKNQFMGAVLVARGNQVVFSKGYGSANLEWKIPNTPNTKFRLGSVTKQFTGAAILLLQERGKLSVEDPVKKHLPDAPDSWDKISIFHLLTHTSGIPSFTGFADYGKLRPFAATPAELVAKFRDKPLEFEPGEKWVYSNSGYVLLGHLIEKVSEASYEKFVTDNIFKPLGMNDSGYDSNAAIIPRRASGYTPSPEGVRQAGFIHMTIPHAAGALYSTTEDLLKWHQGLYGGKLLQPASLQKMMKPFKSDYALGIGVTTAGQHVTVSHGGGIEGFNTHLEYHPDEELTLVVLGNVNGSAPSQIAKQLAAVAHGAAVKLQSERKEIKLPPQALSRYVGAYRMSPGLNTLITLEGERLMVKLGYQPSVEIFPESETQFFYKNVDAQIEFSVDPQGKATEFVLRQAAKDMTFKRLDDAEAKTLMASAAATAQRVNTQTAAPGSEAALRRVIEEVRVGKPDYDKMSPALADATRQQLSQLQSSISKLGALQAITFKEVGPGGADIYQAKFEHGALEYRIWMAPDGKVDSIMARPE
ncbi:MAG TPA: serine hydrolase [Bryobacteraceae bacterium]|nr:serine hydrolase [Bryobacteraceae bacterium]